MVGGITRCVEKEELGDELSFGADENELSTPGSSFPGPEMLKID